MANLKFENAIRGIPQGGPPIWFMRQAGRYHKHYQNLRKQHSFMELCKNPKLAAEVTLGPIQDFDFDVAILFSDLLFPLEALGMGLEYGDGGPKLGWHLTSEESLKNLRNVEDALPGLLFQKEAMRQARLLIPQSKSLIGFVGGPWTLFTYAAQGKHDGNLTQAKVHLNLFKKFCEVLVPLLIKNIQLQFDGGAEIIMLFDTAAGELSPAIYKELVVPEIAKLARAFPKRLGYYSKMTHEAHLDHEIFSTGVLAGMGFDHRFELSGLLKNKKFAGFKQGVFDQSLLFARPDELHKHLETYLAPLKKLSREERAGWVCGLGHGVLPGTPEENVKLFIKTVREFFS